MKQILIFILLFSYSLHAQDKHTSFKGNKEYELYNHLDNVVATITDRKLVSSGNYIVDIKTAQDYYPFGMQMPDRNLDSIYRFGFQGQENDNEIKGVGNSINYKYDGQAHHSCIVVLISPTVGVNIDTHRLVLNR